MSACKTKVPCYYSSSSVDNVNVVSVFFFYAVWFAEAIACGKLPKECANGHTFKRVLKELGKRSDAPCV